jgi:two-component system nitrogen regulation sensor histidine kinase GlnL
MTAAPIPEADALRARAFDAAAVPLLLVQDGAVLTGNAAAEALLGQALRPGDALSELPGDGQALAALARRCMEEGVAVKTLLAAGGLVSAAPLRADLVVLTFQEAAEAEDRAAAGLFAAAGIGRTLAHEVKNPLAGIRGAAQLLRADATGEGAALAQLVIDEVDRIRRLVDRVEALSETRRPKPAPVNLHRVLSRVRVLAEAAHGDNVRIRDRYDPSLPEAWGDEDQLVQIFLNLVNNASEALTRDGRPGGQITLATAYRHGAVARGDDDPQAPTPLAPAPLEVTVEDDGPGVPPGLQPRLFDPFVTSKPGGGGLGLPVVAKLVAQHGGAIEFDSRPGRTVFRVRLPQAAPPRRRVAPMQSAS